MTITKEQLKILAGEQNAEINRLREIVERYRSAVSRESADNLFGGEELAAASKLGDDICDYIERCRTGLQLDGAIRAGVDHMIRKDALGWLAQRPKIIAEAVRRAPAPAAPPDRSEQQHPQPKP